MKTVITLFIGASLAALANSASATEWIDLNKGGTISGKGRSFTDGTVNMRASAWSVDVASTIHQATLGSYSEGLGVTYGKENSHTIDNIGTLDFLMLQFDKAVTLDSAAFRTGWHSMNDTDALIGVSDLSLAYTEQPGFDGHKIGVLSGFNLWSSGSPGKSGNSTRSINQSGFSGNTWLVAAGLTTSPDTFADGFKLKGVSYSVATSAVPEPATWGMLLLGFGAIGSILRRRPARASVSFA